MKNFLLISFMILSIIGCSSESEADKMYLTGNIKGLKKGSLFLEKIEDTLLMVIDSIDIDGNSNFSFTSKVESPEVYYLHVRLKGGSLRDDRITFFAEAGDIDIQTNLKTFGSTAVITGSENNELLTDYNKLMRRYIDRNLELIEQRFKLKADDPRLEDIYEKQNSLQTSRYLATINFALNHKEKEVAPYVILTEAYNANIKYLDTVYSGLNQKIKDSKYGKELESFIVERKRNDTVSTVR